MSKSITNIEMDDVLSSIRRMVSEKVVDQSADQPQNVQFENDRYILTPALRVDADTDAGTDADSSDKPEVAATSEGDTELAGVLATAAVVAEDAEAKTAEQSPGRAKSPEFEAMENSWKEELARMAAARQAQDDEVQDGDDHAAPQTSLENRIAELEDAVSHAQGEWEPDGSEPEAAEMPKRHIFEVVDNTRSPDGDDDGSADAMPVFSHSETNRPKPFLLSDTTAAVPPTATDGDGGFVENQDIGAAEDDPQSDLVEDDDVFLDVEALRTMITDVVRQELRGKLGESITRNVRRMMQQEIAQAIHQIGADDDQDY